LKLVDRVISPNERGKTLAEVLKEHGISPNDQNIQVWIDGKLTEVPPEKLQLKPGWKVEIVPLPSGGGKKLLGAVGAIAVGVLTGGLAATAIGSVAIGGFTLSSTAVFGIGFTIGAGIFSYLTAPKPKLPSFGDVGSDAFGSSPTYSWNGIQTVMAQGIPIPVVYGKHAVGGVRIQYALLGMDAVAKKPEGNALLIGRATSDGTPVGKFSQWLADCLILSEGEIESVEELFINDIPYKSLEGEYFNCIYAKGSFGANPVNVLSGNLEKPEDFWGYVGQYDFSLPAFITVPVNKVISKQDKFTYVTRFPSKLIEKLTVNLYFPNGLFKITDSGGLTLEDCKIKFTLYKGYEKLGEAEIPLRGGLKEPFVLTYDLYINKGVQRENTPPYPYGYNFHDPQDNPTLEEFPYTLIIEKLSDDNPTVKDSNSVTVQCVREELGKSADIHDTTTASGERVASVTQHPYKLRYQNTAVLVYTLAASSVVSGTLPNVKAVIKGKKVKVWNFEANRWETAWTDNPAWIIRDILTNPRYGLGDFIKEENIDDESFKAFAQFCKEQGYKCNLVLDGFQRGWDLINNLLAKFRAFILRSGSKYKVKFLKDEPPVQMFTMGNIIQGSFQVHFTSTDQRYNTIEARFLDEADGYKMKTILVSTGEKYERKKTVDFFGITDRATVEKECKFLLNWMQKVKRTITFQAYLDSIAIEPGDIFLFSHDIPKWLTSGRIVGQEGNGQILILDREIPSQTNYVKVRTKNDRIETFEVERAEGRKLWLKTQDSATPFPEMEGCPYICGELTDKPKLYRCIEITRTAENARQIVAVEHIPELFD